MNTNPSPASKRSQRLRLTMAAAAALALSACASVPEPPTAALQAAEQAIAAADRDRVADYAASELNRAREKLAAANDAVRDEQMGSAERLAVQSRADAELASAKADAAKAALVNADMQNSIDTLKQEMQRNRGERK